MSGDPSRMCLGCRRARPKGRLVRLVRSANGVVLTDPHARAAGRGAYVCPDPGCVERALIGGRLARAFRKPCVPSEDLALAVRATGHLGPAGPRREAGSDSGVCEAGVMAARA
jgi:uncharacterized protein